MLSRLNQPQSPPPLHNAAGAFVQSLSARSSLPASMPPAFTRQALERQQSADELMVFERNRRSFFKPDFSHLRTCYRFYETGGVDADGKPQRDIMQVPCPPTTTTPKPPKKGWCVIL